jgi:hypothetical protein
MTPTRAIVSGIQHALRTKWMVAIFFGCNLLLAAVLAAPMHSAIAGHLGGSMVGRELAEGFSAAWLAEFNIAYSDFLKGFGQSVVFAGMVFLFLNTVLSAGAFEVFMRGEGAYMHAFGHGLGKFFGRFARLMILAAVMYFVAFWLFNGPLAKGVERLFVGVNPDRWYFYLTWLRLAVLGLVLLAIRAIVDYAKADLVVDEHFSIFAAIGHAAGFVLGNFARVLAMYVVFALAGVATVAVYVVFANLMPQHTVATIFIWFVVAQALLWVRWMFRLSNWAADVAFYRAQRPVLAAPATPPSEPAPAQATTA